MKRKMQAEKEAGMEKTVEYRNDFSPELELHKV
jgi:hypothetical protein